jgi:hypothetical protein
VRATPSAPRLTFGQATGLMFLLELDLHSFADLRRPGVMARVGRAFDADPRLKLGRMDVSEPVRNVVASAEAYLNDAAHLLARGEILFERKRDPHLSGELSAPSYLQEEPVDLPHGIHIATGDSDAEWLREPANLESIAQHFVRLAGAFDGSYGFAADHQMWRQQAGEFGRIRRSRRFAPPTPGQESDRHSVRDVYWLNYFGPAYLELWGDRVERLGVRREPTSNGGLVIWATETPFVYEEGIGSFMDYAWKKPFYEALGLETFVNAVKPSWDSRVPTEADHWRHATRAG